MTSAPRASACVVGDRFLGRRPQVLGLVARHLRLNLSDVVVDGDRGAVVVLRFATMLTQHVVLVALVVSVVLSTSHPRPPACRTPVYRGCPAGTTRVTPHPG